jgi:hypothetical protein
MPLIPFEEWTANKAKEKIPVGLDQSDTDSNRLFYAGEHWQNASGWIGPLPKLKESEQVQREVLSLALEVQNGFVSKNAIGETIDRHRDGVIGTEPDWGFTIRRAKKETDKPDEAEQRAIDEAEAFMTTWWDSHKVHQSLKSTVEKLLYSAGKMDGKRLWPSRAVLRLYVPRGALDETTVGDGENARVVRGLSIPQGDIAAALEKIYVDVPEPDAANVWADTETMTMLEVGIIYTSDAVTGKESVELSFLDANKKTVIRTFTNAAGDKQDQALDLGGRLTMYKLERAAFVTPQVRQNQKALNLEATMVPRNATLAGFLERIILNGQVPGQWVNDPTSATGKRFVPAPYYTGAGTLNWIQGQQVDDGKGGKNLMTPQVHEHEPTPPTTLIEAKRDSYRDILEETDQLHALLMADATASGESRKQARGEFGASLRETQIPLEAAGRWILETALRMAEVFANRPGLYTDALRASFRCRLDTGPLSDAEQTTIVAQVEGGVKSRATGMTEVGVHDPEAELARINEQDGGNLDVRTKKATIYGLYIVAGLTEMAAAELAGLSEEERKVIEKMLADAPPPPDPNAPPADPNAPPGRQPPARTQPNQPPAGRGGPPARVPPARPQPPASNNRVPAGR